MKGSNKRARWMPLSLGISTWALLAGMPTNAQASASGFRVSERAVVQAPAEAAAPAEAPAAEAPSAQPAPAPAPAPSPAPEAAPTGAAPADGGPGEVRDMTEADKAAPLPAPEPEPEPAPEAPAEPAEGPAPEEYSSSKDAGTALSGGEVDDRTTTTTTVGKQNKEKKEKNLSHERTGILGVSALGGVSMITAGDKFCGEFSDSRQDPDSRKPVCTGRTPFALDFLAGYGASSRIDIVVNVRLNLEKRDYDNSDCGGEATCAEGKGLFNTKLGIGVAPGIRVYGKETNKIVKLGGMMQLLYMNESFEGYRTRPTGPMEDDNDTENADNEDGVGDHFLGLRGGPVLQIDPHHNFGITLQPAMIPGFRPKRREEVDGGWFEIGFELALGLEARFP